MREIKVGDVVRQSLVGEGLDHDVFTVLHIIGPVIDTSCSWDHTPAIQMIVHWNDLGVSEYTMKIRYLEQEFYQTPSGRLVLRTEIL